MKNIYHFVLKKATALCFRAFWW